MSCIVNIDHMRLINPLRNATQHTIHAPSQHQHVSITSASPLECTVSDIHQNIHISDNHFGPHVSSRSPVKERSIMTIKAQCAILKTACLGLFRYFAFVEPYPINYAGGPRAGLHHHLWRQCWKGFRELIIVFPCTQHTICDLENTSTIYS